MTKRKDPFGDTIFIRLEVHNMGYGYNIAYSELDSLMVVLVNDPDYSENHFIQLELLSGSRIFIRARNISDFSISTPEARKYNVDIEEMIEANEKKEWE